MPYLYKLCLLVAVNSWLLFLLPVLHAQQNGALLDFQTTCQIIMNQAFELKAASAAIDATHSARQQAAALPNPDLSVFLDTIGRDVDGNENELSIGLSQLIELGGKRSARMRLADAEQFVKRCDYEIVRCNLSQSLLHAFINISSAQERILIAEGQFDVAEKTSQCAIVKADAGKTSPIDAKKAELACKTAHLFLDRQRAGLATAIQQMLRMWDSWLPPTIVGVNFPLYGLSSPPSLNELSVALANNPDLVKSYAEVIRAKEMITLECAGAVPDVAVQVGVTTERFTRQPALNLGFEMPLPIFDRNRGNICRAKHEYQQALYNQWNMESYLNATLAALYEEWTSAFEQAMALKNSIMPDVNEAYELALQNYDEGKLDYATLLDARRAILQVQLDYLEAVVEYHHKRADVLRLTAQCCPD